jgi:hypothetical protein
MKITIDENDMNDILNEWMQNLNEENYCNIERFSEIIMQTYESSYRELKWISIKDCLPKNGETVLVLLDNYIKTPLVARWIELLIGSSMEYKNTWFILQPPRFPKQWAFTEEYNKVFRLKKQKISHWSQIPEILAK